MLELFGSPRRAALWLLEGALLTTLLVGLATQLPETFGGHPLRPGELLVVSPLCCALTQGALYYHGLYSPEALPTTGPLKLRLGSLFGALLLAGLLLVVGLLLTRARLEVRTVLLGTLAASALALPLGRLAFLGLSRALAPGKPTLVLGTGSLAEACARSARRLEGGPGAFLGFLATSTDELGAPGVVGQARDLETQVRRLGAGRVVVAYGDRRGSLPTDALLRLKLRGVEVLEGEDFLERRAGRVHVGELRPSQLIFAEGFRCGPWRRASKRALDLLCASVGLVLASPLLLLSALAIKLDSRGPVLYTQERAGLRGRTFRIYKLRSMRTDAEAGGARFAEEHDPRVTQVGRFLRRTRLDELPQLWNVLRGEMSMVGPRPERPLFVDQLEKELPYFRLRLEAKPGVTGHAQVRAPYGSTLEAHKDKLEYDLYYMKKSSMGFDLSVLVDTVRVVLLRVGSR